MSLNFHIFTHLKRSACSSQCFKKNFYFVQCYVPPESSALHWDLFSLKMAAFIFELPSKLWNAEILYQVIGIWMHAMQFVAVQRRMFFSPAGSFVILTAIVSDDLQWFKWYAVALRQNCTLYNLSIWPVFNSFVLAFFGEQTSWHKGRNKIVRSELLAWCVGGGF